VSELQSPPDENEPTPEPNTGLPPGNHPLEIAARRGIGPLSPLGNVAWHGHAEPCVSCGQLVKRGATECEECGQDLSPAMLAKMRGHAGPWYVLEHVRPFPGVSLERIIRQIRRGLITETSIVRGPASDYQWRFAVEIPGLCRYFGCCWQCHKEVSPSDAFCQFCLSHLSFEKPVAGPTATQPASPASQAVDPNEQPRPDLAPAPLGQAEAAAPATAGLMTHEPGKPSTAGAGEVAPNPVATPTPAQELARLSAAVGEIALPSHEPIWDDPPRVAGVRATWIVAALLIAVIVVLLFVTQTRSTGATATTPTTPSLVQPSAPSPAPGETTGG
jgi:hypothetical protein